MVTRIAAGMFAAIALAACSLGALDGFTSPAGEPDATSPETGSNVTPDGTSPSNEDGSIPGQADADAGVPAIDAGPDARFCAAFTNIELCADYDDGTNPLLGWAKDATGTADAMLVTSGSKSAPNAVRAAAGAAGSNRWAFFDRPVGTSSVDRARLTYALYVEQRPTTNELEVNGLVFTAARRSEFYLAVASNGSAYIVEQAADLDGANFANVYHDLGTSIPTAQWVQVSLELFLSGTKELVLSVDGVERARKALTVTNAGTPKVRAGITWADKTSANGAVVIDDLRFDALP